MLTTQAISLSDWHAELKLCFEKKSERCVLSKNKHKGPLLVQKPFYPEGNDVCHVYILHPPGGVVQGDQLSIDVQVKNQAHSLITTPAAGKFYRSNGKVAVLKQHIKLENQAKLEWLPQETLVFNESQVNLNTLIYLQGNARFIGWEMLCLGRVASKDKFRSGAIKQSFEVWRDGKALFIERAKIEGGTSLLTEQWGLANLPLSATMVATHCSQIQLKSVQNYLHSLDSHILISCTLKKDLLICRFLGHQAEHAREYFIQIWKIIRVDIMGKEISIPRIWNT